MFSYGFRRGTTGPHNGKGAGFGVSTGVGVLSTPNTSNFIQQRIARYTALIREGALYLSLKNDRYLITQKPHWHGCTREQGRCKCSRYDQQLENLSKISGATAIHGAYQMTESELPTKLCLKAEEMDPMELSMNRLSAQRGSRPFEKDDFLILYLDRSKLPKSKLETPQYASNLPEVSSPLNPLTADDFPEAVTLSDRACSPLSNPEPSNVRAGESEVPLEIFASTEADVPEDENVDHESGIIQRSKQESIDSMDVMMLNTTNTTTEMDVQAPTLTADLTKDNLTPDAELVVDTPIDTLELVENTPEPIAELFVDSHSDTKDTVVNISIPTTELIVDDQVDTTVSTTELSTPTVEATIANQKSTLELVPDTPIETAKLAVDTLASIVESVVDSPIDIVLLANDVSASTAELVEARSDTTELVTDTPAPSVELVVSDLGNAVEPNALAPTLSEELAVDTPVDNMDQTLDDPTPPTELVIDTLVSTSDSVGHEPIDPTVLTVETSTSATELIVNVPVPISELVVGAPIDGTGLILGTPGATVEVNVDALSSAAELVVDSSLDIAELAKDILTSIPESDVDTCITITELPENPSTIETSIPPVNMIADKSMPSQESIEEPSEANVSSTLGNSEEKLESGLQSKSVSNENNSESTPTEERSLSDSGYLESESNLQLNETSKQSDLSSTHTEETSEPVTPPATPSPRRRNLSNSSSKHSILSLTSDIYSRLKNSKSFDLSHTSPSEASSSSEKKKKGLMSTIKRPVRTLTRSATELFHLSPRKRAITTNETISTTGLSITPSDQASLSPTKQKKGLFGSTKKFFRKRTKSMDL